LIESKTLPEDEVGGGGRSEEQFYQPEPYQQEKNGESDFNNENGLEDQTEKAQNMWQNLMDAPK